MIDVTRSLSDLTQGDAHAAGQLLPLVYEELRKLAAARMAEEAPGNTLNATALVHEAYLRLVGPADAARWDNCGHFFSTAAEAMPPYPRGACPPEAARECPDGRGLADASFASELVLRKLNATHRS